MAELLIFNDADDLLCIASNDAEKTLWFRDARFTEKINELSTLEFCCEPDHEDSPYIDYGNQVAFLDKDGFFRLFRITNVEYEVTGNDVQIKALCDDAIFDLESNILEDIRPQNASLRFALERALSGQTRWQVGEVTYLGQNSTNYHYISSLEAIEKCLEIWAAELRVRVEISGSRITGRFVDAISRGSDTGLVMEVEHNIEGLSLQVETAHICTLVYGRGSGIPSENGGWSRRIMFNDLVATMASHGFVKPRGQPFLVDEEARELYGLAGPTGQRAHLEGVFIDNSEEDPDALMRKTWKFLQENNKPHYLARGDVIPLAELLGEDYAHEQLRLGDVIRLADHESFTRALLLSSRVTEYAYNLADYTDATVALTNFRNLDTNSSRLSNIETGLNNGMWQRPPVVGPGNIANITPEQVTGFKAFGGFGQIHLMWNHQGMLVRDFELHGSEVEDFIPDDSNIIYRGAVAAFSHNVNPNRRWYYRCRAVNYHNVRGEWSIQVHAQTANTFGLDQLEEKLEELNEVTLPHLSALVEEWQYLDTVEIDGATIRARTIQALSIEAGSITALEIAADTITANNLAINTITANRIASNAIIARHITAGSIVADHIAAGAITSTHIEVGTLNGNVIQTNSLHGNRITARTITADHLTANAIQVGFNAIGDTIQISPTRLSFMSGGEEAGRLTSTGLQYWRGGRDIGRILHSQMHGNPNIRGMSYRTQYTGNYTTMAYQPDATGLNPSIIQMLFDPYGDFTAGSGDGNRRPGIHVMDRLFVRDMATRSGTRMDFSVFTMVIGGIPRVYIGTDDSTATRTGIAFGGGQVFIIRNNSSTQL